MQYNKDQIPNAILGAIKGLKNELVNVNTLYTMVEPKLDIFGLSKKSIFANAVKDINTVYKFIHLVKYDYVYWILYTDDVKLKPLTEYYRKTNNIYIDTYFDDFLDRYYRNQNQNNTTDTSLKYDKILDKINNLENRVQIQEKLINTLTKEIDQLYTDSSIINRYKYSILTGIVSYISTYVLFNFMY